MSRLCMLVGSFVQLLERVTVPLIKSIQELTLIFSLVFIIFRASSSSTSPVRVSSMTSIMRSASGKRRLPESFCILILPLNANSMTMHPLSA